MSLALRSDANYEVGKAIPDMGWRLRKHYYTVKNRQNPKQELLLAWVEFGPDKHLQDKDMQGVFKSLGTLKHAHVEGIVHQHVTENGALTIRNFHADGTLRDILCNSKPKQPFIKKYGNPKQTKSLAAAEIATYAYQVCSLITYYKSIYWIRIFFRNEYNELWFSDLGSSVISARKGIALRTFTHWKCSSLDLRCQIVGY